MIKLGIIGRCVLLASSLSAAPSMAQHQAYAGLQNREIKALSEQQVTDMKEGRGMGLALAAELNGYPGPSHVLELGDKLGLTDAQLSRIEALFSDMKQEALLVGERLIAQEADLDRLFATSAVTPGALMATTAAIGTTQAALRATHLKYHLTVKDLLTPEQIRHYAQLRGYGAGSPLHHGPTHRSP